MLDQVQVVQKDATKKQDQGLRMSQGFGSSPPVSNPHSFHKLLGKG